MKRIIIEISEKDIPRLLLYEKYCKENSGWSKQRTRKWLFSAGLEVEYCGVDLDDKFPNTP